jgi:hypothetical protein
MEGVLWALVLLCLVGLCCLFVVAAIAIAAVWWKGGTRKD